MEFKFSGRKEYLYIELLRQLTAGQRLWIVQEMTHWEVSRQREEIAKANPQFTDEEVRLKWVELTYGASLAEGLRADLQRRQSQA